MRQEIQIGDVALSLDEAAETLRALRAGDVDAVVVQGESGDQIFTFRDPSHPYRLLVEAMSEGAALVTPDGLICYDNPCFGAMIGCDPASLTGRSLAELVTAEDRPLLSALLSAARSGTSHQELHLAGEDGRSVPVLLSVSQALLAEIEVLCVVATDLTEHKRQEDRYHAARAAVEARDRMFAVAAHELRNPLSVLQMQTYLLRQLLAGSPVEKVTEMIEQLSRQGQQLATLVNKLLDIGSLGSGGLRLEREDVELAGEVRTVIARTDELVRRSGSQVNLELSPVTGRWDRTRLQQVIENLISNAAKYGNGGPIRVVLDGDQARARLIVEDHGPGIPAGDRERLFRPYERMETARAIPGLGLGLYITAEIVKAHGGSIRVESGKGIGARFVVELPRR